MSNTGGYQSEFIAKANAGPDAQMQGTEQEVHGGRGSIDVSHKHAEAEHSSSVSDVEHFDDTPTAEEMATLPRVSGVIKWSVYTIAFAECCERFSYYGSAVLYTNFVQRPRPEGQPTGSNPDPEGTPGALGMGQKASQGINLFNQFWAYFMPLVGAYIADAKLGRYVTIHIAIAVSTVAHVVLTAAAAPSVLNNPNSAFGAFIIGLLILCTGTGFFKANISPLLAEQNQDTRMRVEVRKGKRVIVDPAVTNTRIFLWFYFAINVGATGGQIAMVWVEKLVGFYLAFLLPTVLFLSCPFVLWLNKKKYILSPPTGSVLSKFLKMFFYTTKRSGYFKKINWELAKPSNVPVDERPKWMTYDDQWVEEVKRGLMACKVFLFLPIFHLSYNQMTGNLTSQAATMQLNGVPNDIIQNLNPLSIVIMVPIMDHLIYPGLRKIGLTPTPIRRMAVGFFFGAFSMVAATVMQYYIYQMSPCGYAANSCDDPAPINVWAQCLPYILIGISEIFTNVTSYEYAFSKAPTNMRSLVMSINLFMSAVASALGQGWTPLSEDPLLLWNYGSIAIIAFLGGCGFWLCFRHLDQDEDKLNSLEKTKYIGKVVPNAMNREEEQEHTPVREQQDTQVAEKA